MSAFPAHDNLGNFPSVEIAFSADSRPPSVVCVLLVSIRQNRIMNCLLHSMNRAHTTLSTSIWTLISLSVTPPTKAQDTHLPARVPARGRGSLTSRPLPPPFDPLSTPPLATMVCAYQTVRICKAEWSISWLKLDLRLDSIADINFTLEIYIRGSQRDPAWKNSNKDRFFFFFYASYRIRRWF